MRRGALPCVFCALISTGVQASAPCEGVDRGLSPERTAQLSRRAAERFHDPTARALQSFAYDDWSIVHVDLGKSGSAFVFYRGDPLANAYSTVWRGAAGFDETSQIKEWTVENVPGIPNQLARCFAWQLARSRAP
jgi:hypothetical protein